MTSRRKQRLCLRKWKIAFEEVNRADTFWEGRAACNELKKIGLLDAVMLKRKGDARRKQETNQVIALIEHFYTVYKNYEGNVVTHNAALRDSRQFFAGMLKKFRIEARRTPRYLRYLFRPYTTSLSKTMTSLNRSAKPIDIWKLSPGFPDWIPLPAKYKKTPIRNEEVDWGFQINIALVLQTLFMREQKIPVRTISRLIVLLYICLDLAKERDGHLFIIRSGQELTVDPISQRLREAGVGRNPRQKAKRLLARLENNPIRY